MPSNRELESQLRFSSWPALKNHVDGLNLAALLAAAEAGVDPGQRTDWNRGHPADTIEQA